MQGVIGIDLGTPTRGRRHGGREAQGIENAEARATTPSIGAFTKDGERRSASRPSARR